MQLGMCCKQFVLVFCLTEVGQMFLDVLSGENPSCERVGLSHV